MDMVTDDSANFFQLYGSLVSFTPVSTNVWVDRPKIALEIGNQSRDSCLGNRQQPADNIPDPILLSRAKVTSDDPTWIREQSNRQASYLHIHNEGQAGPKH